MPPVASAAEEGIGSVAWGVAPPPLGAPPPAPPGGATGTGASGEVFALDDARSLPGVMLGSWLKSGGIVVPTWSVAADELVVVAVEANTASVKAVEVWPELVVVPSSAGGVLVEEELVSVVEVRESSAVAAPVTRASFMPSRLPGASRDSRHSRRMGG